MVFAPSESKALPLETPQVGELSFANRFLAFYPAVDARFESDHGIERGLHLRKTILIGLIFYNAYNLTSILLERDIIWIAITMRLFVVTPVSLWLAWIVPRVKQELREALVTAGMINATACPLLLFWLSHHPLSGYSFVEVPLCLVFGTMMLVLRFPQAILMVAVSLATTFVIVATKPGLGSDLAAAFALQATSGGFFVLYGNYQIEATRRKAYLLSLREILRSSGLETDRLRYAVLSTTDSLTGLSNRRGLDEFLADVATCHSSDSIGILMIDVDHFKIFNDTYGHLAGDVCLRDVAKAIACEIRVDHDLAVRYGGEEFAVISRNCDEQSLEKMAFRIRSAIEALGIPNTDRPDGLKYVTISVGGALTHSSQPVVLNVLLSNADEALYQAKHDGRNRHMIKRLTLDATFIAAVA